MVLLPCSSCCCTLLPPPAEIEIEISSSTSHFGSVVIGRYLSGGCVDPSPEASMSVLITAPVGVFTLTPATNPNPLELPGTYYKYDESYGSSNAAHTFSAVFNPPFSTGVFITPALLRRRWSLGGTPPTESSMQGSDWGDGLLGDYWTGLTNVINGVVFETYRLPKAEVEATIGPAVGQYCPSFKSIEVINLLGRDGLQPHTCGSATTSPGVMPPITVSAKVFPDSGTKAFEEAQGWGPMSYQNWRYNFGTCYTTAFGQRVPFTMTGVLENPATPVLVTYTISRITFIYDLPPPGYETTAIEMPSFGSAAPTAPAFGGVCP